MVIYTQKVPETFVYNPIGSGATFPIHDVCQNDVTHNDVQFTA